MNEIFKKVEKILQEAKIEEYKKEAKLIILETSKQTIEEIIITSKGREYTFVLLLFSPQ